MSSNADDLLKALYTAELKTESLSGTDLSRLLEITPSGVTRIVHKLHRDGKVEYKRYQAISLTSKGREEAASLIRKHRLWEMFLLKVLKMPWEEVHREAELLEHQTTNVLADRICVFLGHPRKDVHGQPIPDKNGKIQVSRAQIPISLAEAGKNYTILSISNESQRLLDYFRDIGLTVNAKISLLEKIEPDGSLIISIKGIKSILSPQMARNIFVE